MRLGANKIKIIARQIILQSKNKRFTGSCSGLFEKSPVTFIERINNPSNIHLKPKGETVIKDMFGRYKAMFNLNYGTEEQTLVGVSTF